MVTEQTRSYFTFYYSLPIFTTTAREYPWIHKNNGFDNRVFHPPPFRALVPATERDHDLFPKPHLFQENWELKKEFDRHELFHFRLRNVL